MSEIENGDNGGGPENPVAVTVVNLAALAAGGKQVSAFLLRRMAEAVDGDRGKQLFCRARFTPNEKFDFEVKVAEKSAELQTGDDEFGIFGPFFTPGAKGPNLKDNLIKSITVRLMDDRVIKVDPRTSDALFWTVSAVEKFLVPYYASVSSLPYAAAMLHDFDRDGMVCMEHGPETEPHRKKVSDAVPEDPDEETPSETTPLPGFALPPDQKGVGGFGIVSIR